MDIFGSVGNVLLHLLVGAGGFLLGTIVTNIIIIRHRLKKKEGEKSE